MIEAYNVDLQRRASCPSVSAHGISNRPFRQNKDPEFFWVVRLDHMSNPLFSVAAVVHHVNLKRAYMHMHTPYQLKTWHSTALILLRRYDFARDNF
jgi:hypothetical protein